MAAIVGGVNGGTVKNITVHLPAPVDASKLNFARSGAEKLINCKIVKDDKKAFDSALATPTATEETFLGMPVTKMDFNHGQGYTIFKDVVSFSEGITSYSFFCRVDNYTTLIEPDGGSPYIGNANTMPISSDGVFSLPSMGDRTMWAYVESRKIGSQVFVRVCPLVNNVNSKNLNYMPTVSAYHNVEKIAFGSVYTWKNESKGTIYATPVYCR